MILVAIEIYKRFVDDYDIINIIIIFYIINLLVSIVSNQCVFIDGDKEISQGNIMEKLVAFCKSQSVSHLVESPNHIR